MSEETDGRQEIYSMNKRTRGLALIFNYEQFEFKRHLSPRFGSNFDYDRMQKSLTGLGFEVKAFRNLKTEEFNKEIDDAAKADHSDADCFVLVYMSHGEDDYVHTADEKLKIKDITDKFKGTNCKGLKGKPKIFIWQVCRGDLWDQACDGKGIDGISESASLNILPSGADFIMCYSVAKGILCGMN